ncbi:MAG: DNA primase, partial [Negativicutes bacterium]
MAETFKLFKGGIETKDKKAAEAFKNRMQFKSYDQCQYLNEFAMVLGEDTVLLDFDDAEQAEIMLRIIKSEQLKCRVVKTNKGLHVFFKNEERRIDSACSKSTWMLAIGLAADIKVGHKNSYAVSKINGKLREIIY